MIKKTLCILVLIAILASCAPADEKIFDAQVTQIIDVQTKGAYQVDVKVYKEDAPGNLKFETNFFTSNETLLAGLRIGSKVRIVCYVNELGGVVKNSCHFRSFKFE